MRYSGVRYKGIAMEAAAADSSVAKLDGLGPLEEEEIVEVVKALAAEAAGEMPTRRAVRDRLGRGSMTTINRVMQRIEADLRKDLPGYTLTLEEEQLLLSAGRQLFKQVSDIVKVIADKREGALAQQSDKICASAAQTILDMEEALNSAIQGQKKAEDERRNSQQEQKNAENDANFARSQELQLRGQIEILSADRSELQKAYSKAHDHELQLSERLTFAQTELEKTQLLLDASNRKILQINSEFDSSKRRYESEKSALNGRISILQHEIDQANSNLSESISNNLEDKKTIQKLQDNASEQKLEIETLKRINGRLEENLTASEKKTQNALLKSNLETQKALAAQREAAEMLQKLLKKGAREQTSKDKMP